MRKKAVAQKSLRCRSLLADGTSASAGRAVRREQNGVTFAPVRKKYLQGFGNLLFFLVIAALLAACGASTPDPTPTPPTDTIRVEVDGSGDYATLEEAVAAVAQRGTITLGAGSYRLVYGLEIDKSFTLIGAGMDESEIVSGAGDYVVRFAGSGTFAAQDITFRHDGTQMADVVQVESGSVDFSRCRFTGAIYVEDEGNRAGLRFLHTSGGVVRESEFIDNDNSGVMVEGQADPILEKNLFSGNGIVGIGYMGNQGGIARENECTGNAIGIAVALESVPTVERNICNENDYGMAYWDSAGGKNSQNECSRNKIGIVVKASANPALADNDCRDNSEEDIQDLR